MSLHSQTDPLIPNKLANERTADPLPKSNATAIKALGVLRIVLSSACLVAPRWTCGLFQYPIPAAYALLPRLFGVRDLALGELLITAENKVAPDGGRREIKRALWAGIGTDVVDIGSVIVGLATGNVGKMPAAMLGGGAVAFVVLGALGMRGL